MFHQVEWATQLLLVDQRIDTHPLLISNRRQIGEDPIGEDQIEDLYQMDAWVILPLMPALPEAILILE
jgi:hypothetical protein